MFAFFGLGIMEIMVLAIIGLIVVVGPIIAIVAISAGSRAKPNTSAADEIMELRAEVKRLREELARLKAGGKGGSDAISPGEPG
jgi:HAMP domain-containing protein